MNKLLILIVVSFYLSSNAFGLSKEKPAVPDYYKSRVVSFRDFAKAAAVEPSLYRLAHVTGKDQMTVYLPEGAIKNPLDVMDMVSKSPAIVSAKELERIKGLAEKAKGTGSEAEVAKLRLSAVYVALEGLKGQDSTIPKPGNFGGRGKPVAPTTESKFKLVITDEIRAKNPSEYAKVDEALGRIKAASEGANPKILPELANSYIALMNERLSTGKHLSNQTVKLIEHTEESMKLTTEKVLKAKEGFGIENQQVLAETTNHVGTAEQALRAAAPDKSAKASKDMMEILPGMFTAEHEAFMRAGGDSEAFLNSLKGEDGQITLKALVAIGLEHRRIMNEAKSPEDVAKMWDAFFKSKGLDRNEVCKPFKQGGKAAEGCPATAFACAA